MNKPIREGFVSNDPGDEDHKVIEHVPTPIKSVKEPPPNPTIKAKATAQGEAPPEYNPDAPPEDVQWPVVIKLFFKPTRNTRNEIIHALTMRAPTAKDIRQCGNPVRINSDNDVVTDPQAMMQMVAQLSGVYPPMIEELDARDWNSVSFYMQRFFLPSTAGWPTPSSTRTD